MLILEEISKFAEGIPAELKENRGIYELTFTVAERKFFISRQKLTYIAKFRIDESAKLIKFTEMLKERGVGFSSAAGIDETPGFGFKVETYKTSMGPRQGTIEEQSNLFGKKYNYKFDFKTIRQKMEEIAKNAGYEFKYQITPIGL